MVKASRGINYFQLPLPPPPSITCFHLPERNLLVFFAITARANPLFEVWDWVAVFCPLWALAFWFAVVVVGNPRLGTLQFDTFDVS